MGSNPNEWMHELRKYTLNSVSLWIKASGKGINTNRCRNRQIFSFVYLSNFPFIYFHSLSVWIHLFINTSIYMFE